MVMQAPIAHSRFHLIVFSAGVGRHLPAAPGKGVANRDRGVSIWLSVAVVLGVFEAFFSAGRQCTPFM